MKQNSIINPRLMAATVLVSAIMILPACDSNYDFTQRYDYGKDFMQQHYANGEMNQYQYEQNVQVFQKPASTGGTGTAIGAGTSAATSTDVPLATGWVNPPVGGLR